METEHQYIIQSCEQTQDTFPKSLQQIAHPPTSIYYRGAFTCTLPKISLVGTRKASEQGLYIARQLAYELASQGWCIVSGLALGIDGAAHQGALDAQGITWAVLAHGLDIIHPRQHEELSQKILRTKGCLVSQYPPKTPPYASNFLERNRIISGLSTAVVVIEAPHGSGSIVTARHAIRDKKPVFVIPGSPLSPAYAGSLELLRAGARLVRTATDILVDLASQKLIPDTSSKDTNPKYTHIWECILHAKHALSIDDLIEQTTLPYPVVMEGIHELLRTHRIREDGLQTYVRI